MAIEPRLKQLLESWEDLRDAEQTLPTPEEHCRKCPELLEAFRRLLRRFERLEEMSNPAGGGGPAPAVPTTRLSRVEEMSNPAGNGGSAARGTVAEATSRAVRFRVDGEPRRGGMGEVFPARDEELGRTVALKFIQRGKGGLEVERRFRREVAITARLQHPGVVPVYGPAVSEDGRSGYAMRFIAGESLDTAIARHHAGDTAEQKKPTRAELLDRFEAVCNTMAYAHSHGVIHRDLKPANVMLGKYGETFVVDWGLAKILADDPAEEAASEELTAMTAPGEDSTGEAFTATGLAIGTYAYMPPEQAHGDYARLNERADVFALGAMLCKILTGQSPYTGKRVVQMARDADLTACFARLDVSGADAELIALAKRCLEKSATNRPTNAQAVLDAVRAHKVAVVERAREERERRVAAEAKSTEERRRRRVTAALAVSVVAVLIVGGGGLWAWQEQRALRQAEKRFQAEASLAQLDDLYKHFLWDDAEKLLARAEAPEGDNDLRERIAAAKRNTAFIKRLDEIQLEKSLVVDEKLNEADAPAKYRAAFEENGFDVHNGDQAELAAKLKASPVWPFLLAALDDWATTEGGAKGKEILAVTAAATGQTWRTQLSDVWDDGDRLDKLYEQTPINERTSAIISAVGWRLHDLGKDGIRRVEEGIRHFPRDFWLHFSLGWMGGKERADARIGAFRAALAIRPGTPSVVINLGNVLRDKKEYDAAVTEYKKVIRLDPKYVGPHNNLGIVLRLKKDYPAAIAAYKEAIRLDPKYAWPHCGLGNVFADMKMYDEAITEYKEAIRLDPKMPQPHHGLGTILYERREYAAAIAAYKEAIRLDPKFALPHRDLGTVLYDKKEYDAAIAEYKEAIRLDPEDPLAHYNLGVMLRLKKEYDAAIAEYKKAIRLDPENALTHNNLGYVLQLKKEYDAAIAEYKKANRLDGNYALAYANLGFVYQVLGRFPESVEVLGTAHQLDRKDANIQKWLRVSQEYMALDQRFPAIRYGTENPKTPIEAVKFAHLASAGFKKDYALAFRLYTDAFAAEPKLVEGNRYYAACAAVQFAAACVKPDMEEWHRLQKQAHTWLAADLDALRKHAASDKLPEREHAQETLTRWLEDSNLAPVRDPDGLKAMPDDERKAWEAGWAEARALFEKLNALEK